MFQRCIVIGASAGGFEVIVDIASKLPADLPAPVFVVMHVSANHHSYLPQILEKAGPLTAIHPADGQKIEPGFIYVAPPDHHLLMDDGQVAVKRGPKENGFRPAIDALFRSAAYSYGPGVIGVVLSGALSDGASGLWTIKRLGGTAIVQDPEEAQFPSMPRSALEYVDADYSVRAAKIPDLLRRLANEPLPPATSESDLDPGLEDRIAKEVQIAAGTDIPHKAILELGELVPYTCPECQGSLVRIVEGKQARYRCHTGHGFTEEALLDGIIKRVNDDVWQTVRGLQEAEMLLEHMGRHIRDAGDPARAEKFFAQAHKLARQANRFQEIITDNETLSIEPPGKEEPSE